MKYHHIGVPVTSEKKWTKYIEGAKVHVTDADTDEFGIEWLKFENGSPMPELIQKQAHVAFLVDSLDAALKDRKVIVPPFNPAPELYCAFIEHDGLAIELIEKLPVKKTCGCSCGCG